MALQEKSVGRRERAKTDKRDRIMRAAREMFAERGVSGVTTQQVADRADVAIGTLYLYAATKAELLIMVQNDKFADAVEQGLAAPEPVGQTCRVMAVLMPVVQCVREQVENGRTYLHELVFGDPDEPHRRTGLMLSGRLEAGVARRLEGSGVPAEDAEVLARVVTAIVHVSTTATVFAQRSLDEVLADIRSQVDACLPCTTAAKTAA
ncbi:TetR/AcrR family transcriptional regulator [Curtobacterium sp. VKM Ac-2861]|uniref:TetR/AcrR family transcriptional regulator n=1 Tax=unclassified Curtobacterium TaxID=257496 RepID=UPI000FB8D7CB|nr:TetR/AcrR family transcriptional regulator [Curtobacterium sp. PhB78]NQW91237.1 TetR/AcrR family transcriptional regulator [Curtobacterium sp. VKM Ac-2861]ROS36469.1 TetR family transcriptional regulator [Curtobacterium sp. PhB78]